jgi:hypothetical protein
MHDKIVFMLSGEMGHHTESSLGQPAFNPYLEGAMTAAYPGQYGALYPHHFSKLRPGPHDLAGYGGGDYPVKPQQAVPTYKWMQVKRNVPKPGRTTENLSWTSDFLPTNLTPVQ